MVNKSAPANRRGRRPFNGSDNTTQTLRSTVAVPAVAELGRWLAKMSHTTFWQLKAASLNDVSLAIAYEEVLGELFARPFWQSGTVQLHRVLWSDAKRAKGEDKSTFDSSGLYIWGVEDRPLYIGKTVKQSFEGRLGRYIWQTRSQCNLALEFEDSFISRGNDGLLADVRTSSARLRGAVRFAEEGITKIWFALFPHDNPDDTSQLEKALIRVAAHRNRQRNIPPILNVKFAPKA